MLGDYELRRLASEISKRLNYSGSKQPMQGGLASSATRRLASAIAAKLSVAGSLPITASPTASVRMRRLASAVSYKLQKHDGRAAEFNQLASAIASLLHHSSNEVVPAASKAKSRNKT